MSDKKKGKRSPRHIRSAARILQKEARRILKRQSHRIAAEPADVIRACVGAIDTHRESEDLDLLEEEAERLDELLHHHASFARKSALRETVENISIAVLIALGLRSCFYEPFKIPSGSMMPTLRQGDHIFVSKFAYGVQIPFTTTVVGQGLGDIERGDVIVFRYPLDPEEDFIKRVIGLPGDQIKVVSRVVALKRPQDERFGILPRQKLEQKCLDEDGVTSVNNCSLYEETMGDKTYIVRYTMTMEEREELTDARIWKVPEGHVFVMGDNRNESHDSRKWEVTVEAVAADKIVGEKDIRNISESARPSTLHRPDGDGAGDPRHDLVRYKSQHRSPLHDVSLSVWRDPPLKAEALFETLAGSVPDGEPQTVGEMVRGGEDTDRIAEVGAQIDRLVVGKTEESFAAVAYLQPAKAVMAFECGFEVCADHSGVARRLARIVERFGQNTAQDARILLEQPEGVEYSPGWTGRADQRDRYFERVYYPAGHKAGDKDAQRVRLRVFRKPKQDLGVLRDAALLELGKSIGDAEALAEISEDAWLLQHDGAYVFVGSDRVRDMLVVLECSKKRCIDRKSAVELATKVNDRVPKAASDRRRLRSLVVDADMEGWEQGKVDRRERNPFDRVRLEATIKGNEYSAEVEVWWKPAEGVKARLATVRSENSAFTPDDSVRDGGLAAQDEQGFEFAFVVAETKTVVRIRCNRGLCPTQDDARELARRGATNASDDSFVEPNESRKRPFVPRGHIKGRAERIWLPPSRFWLRIH